MKALLVLLLVILALLAIRKKIRIISFTDNRDFGKPKKEGEVTLDTNSKKSKPSRNDGEYVDFTEIKE